MLKELSIYEEAQELVEKYIEKGNLLFGKSISVPKIQWDLKGTTAGQAVFSPWSGAFIRLNRDICLAQREAFMGHTVGHEVAHIVAKVVYGRYIRPHGHEWQRVMRLFGLEPRRCHSYDTSTARKRGGAYPYKCGCQTHQLTITRHRRVMAGENNYTCRNCGCRLTYTP